MFHYLLFDLDGTLTDPAEGITKSVQYALRAQGIDEPDLKKLEAFIGPPLRDSFQELYGMTPAEAEAGTAKYRERYTPVGIYENVIYPGIPELLKKCREAGKILAVASSKPLLFVEKVLAHFGIRQYFTVVMGCEMDGTRGKKEEVVAEVLRLLKLDGQSPNGQRPDSQSPNGRSPEELKREAVMIGDRKFDITGGRQFGLATIGVCYGYGTAAELSAAGADYLAETVTQLEELLI